MMGVLCIPEQLKEGAKKENSHKYKKYCVMVCWNSGVVYPCGDRCCCIFSKRHIKPQLLG